MPRRRLKQSKTTKATKKDAMRLYGLPETYQSSNLRYQNPIEKGILWYWFSIYVRQRDIALYGTCISCETPITMDTCDAGHFMPAASCGRDLLFDERNVNAECKQCNAWDETHLFGYAEGLDKRYGKGTAQKLRDKREEYKNGPRLKDFNKAEYGVLIEHYRALI